MLNENEKAKNFRGSGGGGETQIEWESHLSQILNNSQRQTLLGPFISK